MKVLLIEDVPKLGRAGDVKKVANGYGRNYLIPQDLAVLATPGALKQVEHIKTRATAKRAQLNEAMSDVSTFLNGQTIEFQVRASETGRLYGSVTTRAIAEKIMEKFEVEVSHRAIESQPLRTLGKFTVPVRLTIDLIPEITVLIYREGESVDSVLEMEEGELLVDDEAVDEEAVEAEVEETADELVDEAAAEAAAAAYEKYEEYEEELDQ